MIVIHHNKDLDGFSSGAICKLKYPEHSEFINKLIFNYDTDSNK